MDNTNHLTEQLLATAPDIGAEIGSYKDVLIDLTRDRRARE